MPDASGHPEVAFSRRGLMAAGVAASAGALLDRRLGSGCGTAPRGPRNVIFVVADGMSCGSLAIMEQYLRVQHARPSTWSALSVKPAVRIAVQTTHSDGSLVTDSSAASSAWSTGCKHVNGSVCTLAGRPDPTPILLRARAGGRAVGVATTTTVTHATPAGFYANCPKREAEDLIARQLLDRPIDLAIGGGASFFPESLCKNSPGLIVTHSMEEMLAAPQDARLLGLLSPGHLPMVLDRPAGHPSLADLTRVALRRLSGSSSGFFLQVEAGRVDHASHANDAASLLKEMLEFDATLAACADFAQSRDDTLLIATADHATANPGLAFYGREGVEACARLSRATRSFEWIAGKLKSPDAPRKPEEASLFIADLLTQATGVPVQAWWFDTLQAHLEGRRVDPFTNRNPLVCVMGSLVANSFGVAFLSPDHTGDHVPLLALGPGAHTLPGFIDNCAVHDWMCDAAAIPRPA